MKVNETCWFVTDANGTVLLHPDGAFMVYETSGEAAQDISMMTRPDLKIVSVTLTVNETLTKRF